MFSRRPIPSARSIERGGAPGTVETHLLRPENTVSVVHAILLSGGSAYGLEAGTGVMRFLEEQKFAFPLAAPSSRSSRARCCSICRSAASPRFIPTPPVATSREPGQSGPVDEGSIGAGAGATVGKFGGGNRPMKGGIGTADLQMSNGPIVGAIVAVNPAGTVIERPPAG